MGHNFICVLAVVSAAVLKTGVDAKAKMNIYLVQMNHRFLMIGLERA
jgi:hypothetical protein